MKVLVTGSSGLIGPALIPALKVKGYQPLRLLRHNVAQGAPFWDPEKGVVDLAGNTAIDAVVHLASEPIAKGRWDERTKARILNSRVNGTKLLATFFAKASRKPSVILSASGIGIYGHCGETVVDESRKSGKGFLADVAQQWEAATLSAVKAGIRVVNLRLGMVLSVSGGALKKMLPPFKMGLGSVIGNGKQYMSWVSLDDVVAMIPYLMEHDSIQGPVNLVSPHPVSNEAFTKALGRTLQRPTRLRMSAFVARLIFGEMADALLLSSIRAIPQKLLDASYSFRHGKLDQTLIYLLRKT